MSGVAWRPAPGSEASPPAGAEEREGIPRRLAPIDAGPPPLLDVRALRTVFQRPGLLRRAAPERALAAVDGVSFTLREGETLGVVGESGCGKTTLGRTLLRLIPAASGSVRYRGEELLQLPGAAMRARRRELQMIFQDLDAALHPKLSVAELLAEALRLRQRVPRAELAGRCTALLARVKLQPAKLAAFPGDLSGGEKRRVSIARVLAVEPRLIVADEPLSALDVSIAAQVANLMRDLQDELGLSFLFISHDLRMVELIAHQILVMYLGQVVEQAPAPVLATSPAHPYTKLLWSSQHPRPRPLVSLPADASASAWELSDQERPRSGCRFRTRCPVYRARGEPSLCSDPASEPPLREIAPSHFTACHFPQV
jgi:oligopeptide/dipeptide ABC transporter ATP-binding protein